jgi:hypothetical protein
MNGKEWATMMLDTAKALGLPIDDSDYIDTLEDEDNKDG